MREAPAIDVIDGLLEAGAKVRAFDPVARETSRKIFGDKIENGKKQYDALDGRRRAASSSPSGTSSAGRTSTE